MTCGSLTPAVQRSLNALPDRAAYEWFTEWMPCTGVDKFLALLVNRNVQGNFRSQVAAQWAAVRTDESGLSVTTYGSAASGAGQATINSGDISSTSDEKFFVRFGVKYDLSTGSTAASAEVQLQVAYDSCGRVVGASSEQLQATSSTNSFKALTPWLPAMHAAKVKAAMVVNSLTGDFQWRMTYRTAEHFKEVPSAWTVDWNPGAGGLNPFRTATEVNTTELAPTLTDKMWVQYGIQFNLSSTNQGQATVNAAVAVRK